MTRSQSAVAFLSRIRKRNPSLWERIVEFRNDQREIDEMADQLFEELAPKMGCAGAEALNKVVTECKKSSI